MLIETLVVGMIQANCFIVADEATRDAIVIDPGGDAPVIARRLDDLGLNLVAVIATHGHFDHVEGLAGLKAAKPAPKARQAKKRGKKAAAKAAPASEPDLDPEEEAALNSVLANEAKELAELEDE